MARLAPEIIIARGVTSYPQIYPCIPRDNLFEQHSTELGYRAVQRLTPDYIATVTKNSPLPRTRNKSDEITEVAFQKPEINARRNDADDDKPGGSRLHEWDEKILLSNSSYIIVIYKCEITRVKCKERETRARGRADM